MPRDGKQISRVTRSKTGAKASYEPRHIDCPPPAARHSPRATSHLPHPTPTCPKHLRSVGYMRECH